MGKTYWGHHSNRGRYKGSWDGVRGGLNFILLSV